MSTIGLVINDGYTESGYIKEQPRLHPALRFTFRPMPAEQRARMISENQRLNDSMKASNNMARIIVAKLQAWDLKGPKGEAIEINTGTLGRLKPALHERVLAIVMGLEASDEDPEAQPETQETALADELNALEAGAPVGDIKEDRDAKN